MTDTLDCKITRLYPSAEWVLYGDTYAGLVWLDKTQPKPTAADLGL